MFGNKKIKKLDEIVSVLDSILFNRNLYDYIMDHIKELDHGDNLLVTEGKKGLSVEIRNNNDLFYINLEPSVLDVQRITTREVSSDGREEIFKEISFVDDGVISVVEREYNVFNDVNGKVSSREKKMKKSIYINNKITYEMEKSMSFDSNMFDDKCSAFESVVYVFDDNSAVKREIRVTDENSFEAGLPQVSYFRTDNYCVPGFDTRVNNDNIYVCGMEYTSQEEFQRAITKSNVKELIKKI